MSFASALLLLFLIAFTAALGAANDAYDITVPLKIKDKEYTITFPNTYEGADATARRFCEERGGSFGITTENFDDNCLKPIKSFLTREVDKERERVLAKATDKGEGNSDEKQSMVTLNILDKDHDIFFRASQSTITVAREFCANNIDGFGIAPELIESHCIEPVASVIDAARKKDSDKEL